MTTSTVLSVAASSKTTKQFGVGGNKEATKIKAAPIEIVDFTTDSSPVVATVQNKKSKKQPVPTKKGEVDIMLIDLTIDGSGAKSCCVERKVGLRSFLPPPNQTRKSTTLPRMVAWTKNLATAGAMMGRALLSLKMR
ncbi:hypothetical protein ACA910_000330 [Epithemia clementina (nom. ined.)]